MGAQYFLTKGFITIKNIQFLFVVNYTKDSSSIIYPVDNSYESNGIQFELLKLEILPPNKLIDVLAYGITLKEVEEQIILKIKEL